MANHFCFYLFLTALAITNLCVISTAEHHPPQPSPPTTTPPPRLPATPPSPACLPSPPSSAPQRAPTQPPRQSPSPPPPQPTTILAPPLPDPQEQQLNNIMDALIGAGDFGGWVSILSAADFSSLPLNATLFVPSDAALVSSAAAAATAKFDPFVIPYHIIPLRLTFSDLLRINTQTRLPTLLPTKTILITNNSPSNFTVDDSPVTHPDLHVTASVSIHGVNSILDYSIYGGSFFSPPGPIPKPTQQESVAPPLFPTGELLGRRRSNAACLSTEFPIVFSVACAAFVFKIH